MPSRYEYSIVTQEDDYGDDYLSVFRETILPSSLVTSTVIAEAKYTEVPEPRYPQGLIEPTDEEIRRYSGDVAATGEPERAPEVSPGLGIDQVKQRIAYFIVRGIREGRSPFIGIVEGALDHETSMLKDAAEIAQSMGCVADGEATDSSRQLTADDTSGIGFYL